MRFRSNKCGLAFIALCACLMLGSCTRRGLDGPDDVQEPQSWDVSPVVMLHIGTLNAGRQASSDDVQEKIRSLRIIMIHETGGSRYIEANRLIDIDPVSDAHFAYLFQKRTVVGKKSFYLIANEESVTSVRLKEGSFPEAIYPGESGPETTGSGPSLTKFLNYFEPEMPSEDGGPSRTAAEFETLLNALCFEPESAYAQVDKVVYLPYSAYYTGFDIKETDDYEVDYTDRPMYLVPVATKFFFKFINERTGQPVAVDYLALESTNRSNYLMAQLGTEELNKYVPGPNKSYWWIDWLKLVSEATQEAETDEGLLTTNGTYGWISNYKVPGNEGTSENGWKYSDEWTYAFVPDGPADDPTSDPKRKSTSWMLEKAEESNGGEITPFVLEEGPFYLPEGRHKVQKYDKKEDGTLEANGDPVEEFDLVLKFRPTDIDVNASSSKILKATTEISNLRALFRSTSVRITITLHDGGVNIYAEQADWTPTRFWGYVKDEEEIK